MLDPGDVGHRVVVRRVVGRHGPDDRRPLHTDALGRLTGVTATTFTVETRSGPVTIPRDAVVAAKRVPPRRPTHREIRTLEVAADEAWPAPVRETLGGWLLRAAGGWSGRANSALPLGDPGMPLPTALDEVERWYADRGLPPRVNVPLPLAAHVDTAVGDRGWRTGPTVLVRTATLAMLRDGTPEGAATVLADSLDPAWLALTTGGRAGDRLPPAAYQVLTTDGAAPVCFGYRYGHDGELLAAGRGTVTGNGRWFGMARLAVAPQARRRGLAREVLGALVRWADRLGARDAFLQVTADNTAAVDLYDRLGFTTHHTYRTWRR